jgi:hypothetical protein
VSAALILPSIYLDTVATRVYACVPSVGNWIRIWLQVCRAGAATIQLLQWIPSEIHAIFSIVCIVGISVLMGSRVHQEYIYTIAIPVLSRPSLPAITPCSLPMSTRACWTANKLARVYPSLVSRDLCFTSGKAGSFHSQRIGGRSRSGDAACFDVVVQGSVPDLVGTASLQWSWCHRHRAVACR